MSTETYTYPPQDEIDKLETPEQFLEFFKAIPEERWCANMFVTLDGRRCARGHLGSYCGQRGDIETEADVRLQALIPEIAAINNGVCLYRRPWYDDLTIKGRVVKALELLSTGRSVL